MKLFLVSAQDDHEELTKELIDNCFPDHNVRLNSRKSPLWIIATTSDKTPANVAESLNMTNAKDRENRVSGVVVQLHDYYGYDSMALWQQLETWANE